MWFSPIVQKWIMAYYDPLYMQSNGKSLCDVFCDTYKCAPGEFVDRAFLMCLHRRARPFHRLLNRYNSEFFHSDKDFLAEAGAACTSEHLAAAIKNFHNDCHRSANYLHDTLRFRVSGRRVMDLMNSLMPEQRHNNG